MNLAESADSSLQREILDALPVLVFLEREGRIVFANAEARQMLGHTEGEWVERPMEDVLWGLFPGTAEPQTLLTGTRRGSPFHATLPAKNGRLLPVEGTYSLANAELRHAVIVAHPGGRERAPKTRLMEDVLASIPEAVAIEHGEHLLYTNPAFTRMFGYSAEEDGGGSVGGLIVPEDRLNEHAALARRVGEQGCVMVETVRRNKAGDLLAVNLQLAPLLVDGAQVGLVFTFRDLGERKETEARAQQAAMHDVLTGLPNRALFMDRLHAALNRTRPSERTCGVLCLDLDRFKEINDALGHASGDALLKQVADRLRASLRSQDSAARLGGDEFAVVVEDIVAAGDLEAISNRILGEMARPFDVFGRMVQAGASIGAAVAGPEHAVPDALLRDANSSMYRAKDAGGGRREIFDRHFEVCVASQKDLVRELRSVVDKRLFEYRYLPVYRLASGKLDGFELALCRRRPDGTVEDFQDLLAIADDAGLSIALAREALEAACAQLQSWHGRTPRLDVTLAVNMTRRQLYHSDLAAYLEKALAASGADPSRLVVQAPEAALNENPEAAAAILERLAGCGARVAVVNFGSALASLNHLVRLPISLVKLDRRLTVAAASAGRELTMIDLLIRLGPALGMQIAAQGIETPEQLAALARIGCALGQGPLLSPALDSSQALQLAEAILGTAAPRA